MDVSEAADICSRLYGCRVELTELVSFENTVFRVRLESGRSERIIKVPRHQKGHDAILREQRVIAALRAHDIPVPQIEFTQESLPLTPVPFTTMRRSAGMTLNGLFSADRSRAARHLREAGRILSRLGRIPPGAIEGAVPADVRLEQDLERWRTIRDRAEQFGHLDERNGRLLDAVMVHLKAPRRELVHGDYVMHQILLANDRIDCVVDWGGAGFGHLLRDLGYFLAHSKFYERAGDDANAVVEGFAELYPLDDKATRTLRLFVAYELLWQATFYARANRPGDLDWAKHGWALLAAEQDAPAESRPAGGPR